MCLNIRVHFDGHALIPDQPVDLPMNQPLNVEITSAELARVIAPTPTAAEIQERLRKLAELDGLLAGPVIPLEALRRENMYDDRP
jgi:hypothetical protein